MSWLARKPDAVSAPLSKLTHLGAHTILLSEAEDAAKAGDIPTALALFSEIEFHDLAKPEEIIPLQLSLLEQAGELPAMLGICLTAPPHLGLAAQAQALRQTLENHPDVGVEFAPTVQYMDGENALTARNYKLGKAILSYLIGRHPTNGHGYYLMGAMHAQISGCEDLSLLYMDLAEKHGSSIKYYININRGIVFERAGRYLAASRAFNNASKVGREFDERSYERSSRALSLYIAAAGAATQRDGMVGQSHPWDAIEHLLNLVSHNQTITIKQMMARMDRLENAVAIERTANQILDALVVKRLYDAYDLVVFSTRRQSIVERLLRLVEGETRSDVVEQCLEMIAQIGARHPEVLGSAVAAQHHDAMASQLAPHLLVNRARYLTGRQKLLVDLLWSYGRNATRRVVLACGGADCEAVRQAAASLPNAPADWLTIQSDTGLAETDSAGTVRVTVCEAFDLRASAFDLGTGVRNISFRSTQWGSGRIAVAAPSESEKLVPFDREAIIASFSSDAFDPIYDIERARRITDRFLTGYTERKPFSYIRIGDAEGVLLGYKRGIPSTRIPIRPGTYFLSHLGINPDWLSDEALRTFQDEFHRICLEADVLISHRMYRSNRDWGDHTDAALQTYDGYAPYYDSEVPAVYNRDFLENGAMLPLLKGRRVLLVGNGAPDWAARLRDQAYLETYAHLRMPKVPPNIVGTIFVPHRDDEAFRQMEDVWAEICRYDFDVAFVSASIVGKILCGRIKRQLGAMALDIGWNMQILANAPSKVAPIDRDYAAQRGYRRLYESQRV